MESLFNTEANVEFFSGVSVACMNFLLLVKFVKLLGRKPYHIYPRLSLYTALVCSFSQGVVTLELHGADSEKNMSEQWNTVIVTMVTGLILWGIYTASYRLRQMYGKYVIEPAIPYPQEVQDQGVGSFYLESENLSPLDPQVVLPQAVCLEELSSNLGYYNIKPENIETYAPFGKGYVVIVTNFTGQLRGYNSDAEQINKFFEQKLKYSVSLHKNLSKRQFQTMLNNTRKRIARENYDRFFLFVLSHGNEQGIIMCQEGSNTQKEVDEYNVTVTVSIEFLTSSFSHDMVPNMKGYPKSIITQMCMGINKVQAAIDTIPYTEDPMEEVVVENLPLNDERVALLPINHQREEYPRESLNVTPVRRSFGDFRAFGSDILLGHSSDMGTCSWVTENGSWYIQEMMQVFSKYYKTETVVDMLTDVTDIVGKKAGIQEENGREVFPVHQLPTITDKLSKKFYLKLPSHNH